MYFFAIGLHEQWAISQICSEGSMFIWLRWAYITGMAEASYGVRSNTLKPLTNTQTVRGTPTSKHENERAFRKGSFRELLANISNVAIKLQYKF